MRQAGKYGWALLGCISAVSFSGAVAACAQSGSVGMHVMPYDAAVYGNDAAVDRDTGAVAVDSGSDAGRITCGADGSTPLVTPTRAGIWLTQEDRARLGLRDAPDSLVAEVVGENGTRYVFFSGSPLDEDAGVAGQTMRFQLRDDAGLSPDPTGPDGSIIPVMKTGSQGDPTPTIGLTDAGFYNGYDRDYSGGGTLYTCPAGAPIVYFFHAENHTDPATGVTYRNSTQGWTGLGQARWDNTAKRLVKEQQIIGMHITNAWGPDASTVQRPPISGSGNVIYDSDDGYLYLFYNDRTDDPEYGADAAFDCINVECAAIARATPADVCSNTANPWKKYYHGDFTEPGVLTPADNTSSYPPGTGGHFTPLFVGSAPTALVGHISGSWIMLARGGSGIALRTSTDKIHWSAPSTIVTAAAGTNVLYPNLWTDLFGAAPCGPWVVSYTEVLTTNPWADASLLTETLGVVWQ